MENITDAPEDQGTAAGAAPGGTTPTPAPAKDDNGQVQPRTRRCVGDPPRQTEDPQSPPCVAGWAGDNGSATSKGVSRDEIRIALPGKDAGQDPRMIAAYENYFNKRYEFYGRRLRLIPYKASPNFTSCDNMRADAVAVDEQMKAFASTYYSAQSGQETCYYDELERRKIISSQSSFLGIPSTTEARMAATPYQWNYYPALDTVLRNLGEFTCKQLAGKNASFAKPPISARTRIFGLIINTYDAGAGPPDPGPLIATTSPCGVHWNTVYGNYGPKGDSDSAISIIRRMEAGNVTSIVCLCIFEMLKPLMQSADSETYYPEWIVQNFQKQDDDHSAGAAYTGGQLPQVFGMRTWNKSLPRAEMPYWQAVTEVDPSFPSTSMLNFSTDYWALLVLASGIQMAGPNLTPQTFESGLKRARFPNPNCAGPPYYQACVGFNNGDHTMINDFTLIWWSTTGRSEEWDANADTNAYYRNVGRGRFCYAELGQRYHAGQWPRRDPELFRGNCR